MKQKPTISIVIPTYNEEKNIKKCLESIFRQRYPMKNLEVFIVDGGSIDKTLKIAKNFPIKVIINKEKDAQRGKKLALKKANGELFIYIDADIELRGMDWFNKMVKPILEDNQIVASFSRYYSKAGDSWLTRYLTFDPIQRDPIYIYFSPAVEKSIISKHEGYDLCEFLTGKIPPEGRCLYRTRILRKSLIWKRKKFMELDNLEILSSEGYRKFAYVPSAGFYHNFVDGIPDLLRKRGRNIEKNYLFQKEERYYKWVEFRDTKDLLKIIIWVVYANLFFPSAFVGFYKSIKHKDPVCLVEPLINWLETNYILGAMTYYYAKHTLFVSN